MTLRRGFKTEAERIALEIRAELGWSATDALDVLAVAQHLAIPVVPMSDLAGGDGVNGFKRVFRTREQDSFSAITVFAGTARLVVHNDSHHPNRQASDIAHELSQCILEHVPTPLRDGGCGCRDWNPTYEAEADWLGGTLLVPREGALHFVKLGWNISQIAAHYRVSDKLAGMRIHLTGVLQHAERFAQRWR